MWRTVLLFFVLAVVQLATIASAQPTGIAMRPIFHTTPNRS